MQYRIQTLSGTTLMNVSKVIVQYRILPQSVEKSTQNTPSIKFIKHGIQMLANIKPVRNMRNITNTFYNYFNIFHKQLHLKPLKFALLNK